MGRAVVMCGNGRRPVAADRVTHPPIGAGSAAGE
jgi:hypothetical protein